MKYRSRVVRSESMYLGPHHSADNDSTAVDRARSYLSKFSGVQRVYQFLLAEAAKNNLEVAGGSQLGAQSYDGPWAVFRSFADANRTTNVGNGDTFTWAVTSG